MPIYGYRLSGTEFAKVHNAEEQTGFNSKRCSITIE